VWRAFHDLRSPRSSHADGDKGDRRSRRRSMRRSGGAALEKALAEAPGARAQRSPKALSRVFHMSQTIWLRDVSSTRVLALW